MNIIEEYRIYRLIMRNAPGNMDIQDGLITGMFTRRWTIDGMNIYSSYTRDDGYATEIKLADGRHIDFSGWRARKIFCLAQSVLRAKTGI